MSTPKTEQYLYLDIFENFNDELNGDYPRNVRVTSGFILGRDDSCDIVIHAASVSNQHCQFNFDKELNAWIIKDLESANGIFIEELKITERSLKKDDRFFLGESLIIVKIKHFDSDVTKSFSILEHQPRDFHLKSIGIALFFSLCFAFVNLSTNYFATDHQIYRDLLELLFTWLGLCGLSVLLSWVSKRQFQFVYFLLFQLKALVLLGLLIDVYPLFSISFLLPSVDNVVEPLVIYGFLFVYLMLMTQKLQRLPTMRKGVAIGATLTLFIYLSTAAWGVFAEKTILKTRYSYGFLYPSPRNDSSRLIVKMDDVFDRLKTQE